MANLPTRDNNPGDIRSSSTGFQQYQSPQEGYAALLNDITAKQTGDTKTGLNGHSSLADFAAKYAPPTDGNDTAKYAADLANQLGVSPDAPIGQIDAGKLADAVSKNEGYQPQYQTYNPQPFTNPSKGTSNPASGSIDFSGLPTVAPPPTQDNSHFKAGGLLGAVQDVSHGLGKGVIQDAAGILSPLVKLGSGLEGAMGMKTAQQQAQQGAAGVDAFANQQGLQSSNTGEKVGKGLGTVLETVAPVGGILGKVSEAAGKAPATIAKIAESIAPKQTAKEAAAALERFGGTKGGLFRGATINPDPALNRLAQTVAEYVPGYKPNGSLVDNLNLVKQAGSNLADDLKTKVIESGKDRIYPIKEIAAKLNNIEKPISLKADATLSKQFDLAKEAALKIIQEKGGKVSDLLDARKEFDGLVEKEFPTLYDRTSAPMRTAITSVRNAITDFTAKHLPEDVGLKKSLSDQSNLIRVGENLAEKAVSGPDTEIGKTGIQKIGGILNKPVVKGALTGLGVSGLVDEAKKIL